MEGAISILCSCARGQRHRGWWFPLVVGKRSAHPAGHGENVTTSVSAITSRAHGGCHRGDIHRCVVNGVTRWQSHTGSVFLCANTRGTHPCGRWWARQERPVCRTANAFQVGKQNRMLAPRRFQWKRRSGKAVWKVAVVVPHTQFPTRGGGPDLVFAARAPGGQDYVIPELRIPKFGIRIFCESRSRP